MAGQEHTPKERPQSKAVANLRGNPKNLKRGSPAKPREILSSPELEFCVYVAEGHSNGDAVRWAGIPSKFPNQKGWDLRQRVPIQETIAELVAKRKEEAVQRARSRASQRSEFLHEEFSHRLRKMKTHKYRGDADVAKMFEVGFKSTGEIQPVNVSANAQAAAGASVAGQTAFQIYKGKCMEAKEQQWGRQIAAEIQNGNPSTSS